MSEDEEVEDRGHECESQIFDKLPKCKCGGETLFLGHERPDGKWTKDWIAHFKCIGCGKIWHERRDKPLNIIFSGVGKR